MEILFITLIGLGMVSFFANKRDLMAPTNMVCAVFLIGTVMAWIQRTRWAYDYSQNTTVVIALSIGCMIAGAVIGNLIVTGFFKRNTLKEPSARHRWYDAVTPSLLVVMMITVFSLITSWMYYKDIYINAVNSKPELKITDFTFVGKEIKSLMMNGDFRFQKHNAWFQYMRKGFAYGCIYLYFKEIISSNINVVKKGYLLFPVLPFLFCCYVTGLRTEFIFIVAYSVTIFGVMMLSSGETSYRQYVKIICGAAVAVMVIATIWCGTYLVRNHISSFDQIDSRVKSNIVNNFAIYSGGGIVELDEYLKNPPDKNDIFGYHTLQNVYSKLNRLGFDFPEIELHIYECLNAGKLGTNIFTALRRYIEDYGKLGNYLICLILGMIYTGYYRLARIKKDNPLYIMTYASLVFPLFVMASEDYFFMYLVDTTPLYICGFIIIAWCILCNSDLIIQKIVNKEKIRE